MLSLILDIKTSRDSLKIKTKYFSTMKLYLLIMFHKNIDDLPKILSQ